MNRKCKTKYSVDRGQEGRVHLFFQKTNICQNSIEYMTVALVEFDDGTLREIPIDYIEMIPAPTDDKER